VFGWQTLIFGWDFSSSKAIFFMLFERLATVLLKVAW
jgi:hypothetical protein